MKFVVPLLPLVGFLVGTCSFPALATRAPVVSPHFTTPITTRPSTPASSTAGGLSDAQASALNSQFQRDRLAAASGPRYEIVPPAHPNLRPPGPVPGYQVIRLGRGHFNRLRLAGTVAGIKGLMMVDTGANNSVLSDATYRSLLASAPYQLPKGLPRSVNFNGTTTPLVEATNYSVGASNLGAVPVCLVPQRFLLDPGADEEKGRSYDGLLGQNILRHYNAIVDCGRLVLYLDIDPARKLDLSASFVRHGWTRVPMSDAGNDLTVPCVLNGHRYRLIVDTGAPFTNLDRSLLTEAQIGSHDLPLRGGLMGTPRKEIALVDLDRLQIGGYTATNTHLTATPESFAAFDGRRTNGGDGPILGFLGGDLLAANGAVIDLGGKSLYLKHLGGKAASTR